jgi:hypothetical protein
LNIKPLILSTQTELIFVLRNHTILNLLIDISVLICFIEALSRLPQLRTLLIQKPTNAAALVDDVNTQPTSLKPTIFNPLIAHPELKTLSLIGVGLNHDVCKVVATMVQRGHISSLWLGSNDGVGEEGVKYLVKAIDGNTRMQFLSLYDAALQDRGTVTMAYGARTCPAIRLLDLRRNGASSQALAAVEHLMIKYATLRQCIRIEPVPSKKPKPKMGPDHLIPHANERAGNTNINNSNSINNTNNSNNNDSTS